jgi:voltage-gated potassium channel Kch
MRKFSLSDQFRYRFDNIMSKGTIVLIGWLILITIALTILTSLLIFVTQGDTGNNFFEVMWLSFTHAIDAGTIAGDDVKNAGYVAFMFIMTLAGVFILSILIGVLTSGIESKLDDLRKGRSFVVETDHTIILGWSPQIFSIISELVIANESRKGACITILAPKDKVEMEDEINDKISNFGTTRVVCRTGSPIDLSDLHIVNPNDSRSIIVLSSEADDPDSHVIKTILAIVNNPNRRKEPYHIVAEMRDATNLEVAQMVARDEAKIVLVGDLISRIAVQTCRQSGLSVVYTELLDFAGNEIYFKDEPSLVGKPFAQSLLAYEDSAVMGLRFSDGRVVLNPPLDTIIQNGDSLIVLAEDDNKINLSGKSDHNIDTAAIQNRPDQAPIPERTLILGWNQRGRNVILELDNYVAPGSEVTVISELDETEAEITKLVSTLKNQRVTFQLGNTTNRQILDALDVTSYSHIITLSYSDSLDVQAADARTLITLLHLRNMAERAGKTVPIVSEMLDLRNRELAEVTRADDFIVSDKLISLMLSQVSENKDLMAVFDDLFNADGSELYLKFVSNYVEIGKPVNFYTVVESAKRRNEVAIGYRVLANASDATKMYGVCVNPLKSELVRFTAQDKVIVLAEN